ncbi:Unknown (Maco66) [Spodoptera exigua multiple nucleopolyhedrovirus]|nr:hypothetical protein [Spodoptera exigua multiple nucleopolyhedrovirus]CDG72390.1 Unknown (Maco66) [Spodoptera exigua multiple nucleopolyhedrovirus]
MEASSSSSSSLLKLKRVFLNDDYCCFDKKCVYLEDKPYCLSCIKDETFKLFTYKADFSIVHKLVPNNILHDVMGYGPKTNIERYEDDSNCCKCNKDLIKIQSPMNCDPCIRNLLLIYDHAMKHGQVILVQ